MNIIIPLNSSYLRDRYGIDGNFLELLKTEVLPNTLDRLSFDDRVNIIEIVTDSEIHNIAESYSKVVLNTIDIGNLQNANDVVRNILKVRLTSSDIIVQLNILYPFVSLDSMNRGHEKVKTGLSSSAIGSFTNSAAETNLELIKTADIGVFSIYKESTFESCYERAPPPVEIIGMKASELVSLRSKVDLNIYELVVNSGYKI